MEGKDKYTVKADFSESLHGELGCITCHEGQNLDDMDKAHEGMTSNPSNTANGGVCAACHDRIGEFNSNSLHTTLAGIENGLKALSGIEEANYEGSVVEHAYQQDCSKCHTTCGECHVSRPKGQKGGLLGGHEIMERPPMDKTCYGCHGARNAGEYMGKVGIKPDVHYKQEKMDCMDCHGLSNFHNDGPTDAPSFHAKDDLPTCIECHEDAWDANNTKMNDSHKAHEKDELACQVCHSMPYNNCSSCHFTTEGEKITGSDSEAKIDFKIGLNPDTNKSYKYVLLRKVPTSRDTFDPVEPGLLANFDGVSNYKYAPVHNIQRKTPQNKACNNCHGKEKLFLTTKDLTPDDSKAAEKLVVKEIPKKVEEK